MSTFVQRRLRYTIELGQGDNETETADTKVLLPTKLRSSASIVKVGGRTMGTAQIRIFGLSLDLMNKASTLGSTYRRTRRNKITVEAGDDVSGLATVFIGDLFEVWQDFQGSPETALVISSHAGLIDKLKAVGPASYRGAMPAATIMADLAGRMGLGFENNGVDVVLSNSYYPGTAWQQAVACAEDGDFEMSHDLGILAIWPRNSARGSKITLINKNTGLVGYPTMGGQNNIQLTCRFNNGLANGSVIKVESKIGPANGEWVIVKLSHELSAETNDGPWFTSIEARVKDTSQRR